MEDKIILICATGRSGSTTLQRVINSIPNSNICGENFGAINSLLDFYRKIKHSTANNIPGNIHPTSYEDILKQNIKPAWYNSYNYSQIVQLIRMTIINMFKNKDTTTIWGFKEIRYDSGNINYITDFKELFPQTKVIVHFRMNLVEQSKSGWFKHDANALDFLNKTTNELIKFAIQNKEWCFLNSFERLFELKNIQNLFHFIDCGESYDEELIKIILKNNIKD
jgi:hypothetical protein